jgi:general stress protein CsbA
MESKDYLKDISEIKDLMNKSSRFISLSGLSGILAGMYALIGAAIAYWLVTNHSNGTLTLHGWVFQSCLITLILVAMVSIITAIILTTKKAKKHQAKIWDATSKRLVINFLIPLVVGGLYILIILSQGKYEQSGGLMLIFYGLALVNASKYSIGDIRYLGYIQIILGLLASWKPGYGFWLWVIGFGIMHIVYGTWMYLKYDKKSN